MEPGLKSKASREPDPLKVTLDSSSYCDQLTLPVSEQELPELTSGGSLSSFHQDGSMSKGTLHPCRPSTLLSPLDNEKEKTDKEREQLMRSMRNSQGGVSTCHGHADVGVTCWGDTWPQGSISWRGSSNGQLSQPWLQCLCDPENRDLGWILRSQPGHTSWISSQVTDFWACIIFPYQQSIDPSGDHTLIKFNFFSPERPGAALGAVWWP